VRRWRKARMQAGPTAKRPFGPATVAKTYRLLHAIFETAEEDRIIARNPCNIKGADGRTRTSGRSCHCPSSSGSPRRCPSGTAH
jgi:hypothetical protein